MDTAVESEFTNPDELLTQLAADPNAVDDLAVRGEVVDVTKETFDIETTEWLTATVDFDTGPLTRTEFDSLSAERVRFEDRYASEPDGFEDREVAFIEKDVESEPCVDCGGDGEKECRTCRGEGEDTCGQCHATGRSNCDTCDGNGKIACRNCNNSGTVACERCSGGGNVCDECGGDGTVICSCVHSDVDTGYQKVAIKKTNKSSSGSLGTETVYTEKLERCPCGGDGEISCDSCNGTGTEPCNWCSRTGETVCTECDGGWKPCPTCLGEADTNCDNCNGSGTVSCADCDGKGKFRCDTCDRTGTVFFPKRGTVQYRVEEEVELDHDNEDLLRTVQKYHVSDITDREGVQTETQVADINSQPRRNESTELRRKTAVRTIPVQEITYRYKDEENTFYEIDGELFYRTYVNLVLNESGRRKKYAILTLYGLIALFVLGVFVYIGIGGSL